ncbi:MAG: histidine kinase [Chitinophagaceae bacterium]
MRWISLFVAAFCTTMALRAQQNPIDSLSRELTKQSLPDTSRALTMMRLAIQYETVDTARAARYYNDALRLSVSKKFDYITALVFQNQSYLYKAGGNYRSAGKSLDSALRFLDNADHPNSELLKAKVYGANSSIERFEGRYKTAIEYAMNAVRLYNKLDKPAMELNQLIDISSLYKEMYEFVKEEEYARKAMTIARKLNDKTAYFRAYFAIALALTMQNRYAEAEAYIDSSGKYYSPTDNEASLTSYHLIAGLIYMNLSELDRSNEHFRKTAELAEKNKNIFGRIQANLQLARVLTLQKKYKQAEELLLAMEKEIAQTTGKVHLEILLDYQSRLYEDWGDYKKALKYYKEYKEIADSASSEQNKQYASRLEVEYETAKKEARINLQQASIKQKNTLNYILIGSAVALLTISLLSYRNYRNKQKLQQQRISELEKEKQLLATQALLKGQEDERSRLARDLHDGLGGLLSGVKLQLGAMKGNLLMTEDHARVFNNALNKLDESIREMRRVAHNMMPEALINLGLSQALQDYCDGLSESQQFVINCQLYGLDQRMSPSSEVVVYRIVQELLNNAVKHAGATTILAQVMRQDNRLTITVEDNGRGFDKDQLDTLQTAGLRNIQSRVHYLRGQMDIQSAPGKGTSVHIECTIENDV